MKRVTFTGDLALSQLAATVQLAIDALRTEIGTCPDVVLYEDDIDAAEAEIGRLTKLKFRIERKLHGNSPS